MAIIGIDLGTTNSLAAVWKDGKSTLVPNSSGSYVTPSAVSVDEDGSILVGQAARERLVSHPDRSVSAFKRFMGMDKSWTLGGKIFTPEDLSSLVLRRLREDAEIFLGEKITEAIISVPAYFNDNQRCATKRAGLLAGLVVERLVNEPSAAALACRMADEEDRTFLVFDFGGGTLDISVVDCFDNVVSITAVSGDNQLGGGDFDRAIASRFCAENKVELAFLTPVKQASLLRQAEQCKMALSERPAVVMMSSDGETTGSLMLNNQKMIEICADLFARMSVPIKRALADSEMTMRDIDELILVGGSCRMPVVRQYLTHLLGRDAAKGGQPDTVVALGAGAYAGMKERRAEIRDMLLTDICPFTLGTGVEGGVNGRLLMEPIIERNSVLPTSKVKTFFTASDNQTRVCVDVYQGEARYCSDNLKLGELYLTVPPAPRGREHISVRFTYDINGILEVEATSDSTGGSEKSVIVGKNSGMSEDAVRLRLAELSALKLHPREKEENRAVVARGERLYQETLGEVRARVGGALDAFQRVLALQEEYKIERVRKRVTAFFDAVDTGLQSFDPFDGDGYDEGQP